MNKQEENTNTKPETKEEPKQNNCKNEENKEYKRQWQKFRGWSIKILEDLEHSGGKTSRSISDATFGKVRVISVILCRLKNSGLIEKVENWGWKITRNGLFLLGLNNKTTNNEQYNINNKDVNMKLINSKQKKIEDKPSIIPRCFQWASCHIKKLCKTKVYNKENASMVCDLCVWNERQMYEKLVVGNIPTVSI